MPEITPQEDLLNDSDIHTATYRPDLMPGWFKGCMGLILFYNIKELFSIPGLIQQVNETEDSGKLILGGIFFLYIMGAIGLIVVRYLFHIQADMTVKFAIPVMIVSICVGTIAIVGIFAGEPEARPTAHYWIMVHEILLIATLIHVLRIRNKWRDASPLR